MPHIQLFGDADAAMQLHSLLGDELGGLAEISLGGRDGKTAFASIQAIHPHGGHQHHRAALFQFDEHVHRPVLEHLKTADGDTELLAHPQVAQGAIQQLPHCPKSLGAGSCGGVVKRGVKRSKTHVCAAEHGIGRELHMVERDVRRHTATHQGIAFQGDTRCPRADLKETDALFVVVGTGGASTDQQALGIGGIEHAKLAAPQQPAIVVALG